MMTHVNLSLIGILLAVITISFSMIFKLNIGLSLILGSIVLGLFSLSLLDLLQTILDASISPSTLEMIMTIISITFLNVTYQRTGKAQELAENLGKMIPSKILVAIIPAMFGILPVTGGALFSAPLVDSEGDKIGIGKVRKVFLNMWFRHIPHLVYPLETALIIASHLTGVRLSLIIAYQIPVFIVGLSFGYLMGLRDLKKQGALVIEWKYFRRFLLSFLPILVTLALTALLNVKLYIAVFMGIILLFFMTRSKEFAFVSSLKTLSNMALIGFGVMIFRQTSQASGVWDVVVNLVQANALWPPILLVSLPILIGFTLGESSPSITVSLSMLLTMYKLTPPEVCLIYTCMYFGHLISPLHLCFSVTSEYFKTETWQAYKQLIPATIATLMVDIPLMILLAS